MTESDTSWQQHFQQLVEYKLTQGDCNVPLEYGRHPHLGQWLKDQRKSYHTGHLKAERKDSLKGIGVLWSEYEIKWELRFQQLLEYKEAHGDCNVPIAFCSNLQLSNWVGYQRQASIKNRLSKEHKDKLDSIDFLWDRRKSNWDTRFQQLVEYKQTHGNCDMPSHYEPNPDLGIWLYRQRSLLKGKKIRNDRAAKLESIGVQVGTSDSSRRVFSDRIRVDWETRFQQLVEYKRTHVNCDVPFRYESNRQLARWVSNQRQRLRLKTMSNDRVAKLESIGFQDGQAKISDNWDTFFQELREYVRTHGDCNVF